MIVNHSSSISPDLEPLTIRSDDTPDVNNNLTTPARQFYLRILPLGASITWGTGSTTGNGYRKPLRDQLRFDGWNVNMVGSRAGGSMNDRVSF